MKLKSNFLFVIGCCLAVLAAQPIRAGEDFAFNAEIGAGRQSVRAFELPYQVLQGIERRDFGDLRIYNRQGQQVPFTVRIEQAKQQKHQGDYEMDFFTLPRQSQKISRLQLEIDRYTRRWSLGVVDNEKRSKSYIIIKNKHSKKQLKQIKLHWAWSERSFSVKAKLESSNDLEHWQPVKDVVTLYDLQHGATVLIKDRIDLPNAFNDTYLRLTLERDVDFIYALTGVTGSFSHQSRPEVIRWRTLPLHPGIDNQEWLFDTGGFVPIVKMAFVIPQPGLFYQGQLYSKPEAVKEQRPSTKRERFKEQVKDVLRPRKHYRQEPSAWRFRSGLTQYRLLLETGEINSDHLLFSGVRDRQWRLQLEQPTSLLAEQAPKIKIGWHPVIVSFLAQGEGPFRLAFGNANVKPPVNAMLKKFAETAPEKVTLAAVQAVPILAEAAPAQRRWHQQIDGPKVLLWLILVVTAVVMTAMAYRLYRGMNKPESEP